MLQFVAPLKVQPQRNIWPQRGNAVAAMMPSVRGRLIKKVDRMMGVRYRAGGGVGYFKLSGLTARVETRALWCSLSGC
jgi:hypothetical protein